MNATDKEGADLLSPYRAKRSAGVTPEPTGAVAPSEGHLFVMHKHAATRLHWDLRLQMEGVLRSWAVPKGPSANPKDKRLAVHVEDHPLEYGDFEGIIPEGNYGAGAVIMWDRGEWVALEDPVEGMKRGKLLFELRGYKLRGRWTLVKIKKAEREWLLIKETDMQVNEDGDAFPQGSVVSGLTVEELKAGSRKAEGIRERLEELGATPHPVRAEEVEFMLAEARATPFSRGGWIYELKYDGYRILAVSERGSARLLTRNGHDISASFPEVARVVRALPYGRLVLDGEVVVHDRSGLPSFQRLQKRARLRRTIDIKRATIDLPATLYVFDLLGLGDHDLRDLPLLERKAILREILPAAGALKYSDHVEEQGEAFYDQLRDMHLEGMVAKRADAPYRGGRSSNWVKVRADLTDDFVVVGYSAPKGTRGGFGALHLAALEDDELVYVGRVGSGFDTDELDDVRRRLDTIVRDEPPCTGAPAGSGHTWVMPEWVCEVRYKEFTEDGLLRQPVFERFRDDKPPQDCLKPAGRGRDLSPPAVSPARQELELLLTNLDKVFWPEEGYTKGDLIAYYRAVARWMLPFLRDRPLVMTRFPDGIEGKSFFQKDAPGFAPEWIRRETMWSDDTERETSYFVADDEESLLYVANLGTIPIHVWASRVGTLEHPDWAVIDLDPKDAPFSQVVEVARAARALCEEIELPCYVKTSGSTGLHLLVPLGRQCTHDQARQIGELLARAITVELPEIATIRRLPSQREGKVYLDFLQNGRGKLLVAPYCVRPLPGAPVSMPLRWSEVNNKLDIKKFTIKTAPTRLKRWKGDPLAVMLEEEPDLLHALGKLQERLMGHR
ncbi:MAG: DNA ligase D [Gemmatimonadetes bacterium]|nr:DNA ligase D [Gemmatimonadota bacterium]